MNISCGNIHVKDEIYYSGRADARESYRPCARRIFRSRKRGEPEPEEGRTGAGIPNTENKMKKKGKKK